MQMRFVRLLGSLAVYLLVSGLPFLALAQTPYSMRPDIMAVLPVEPTEDFPMLNAHIAFVAELLETYPADTHVYFLARDAENLFDVAKLLTANTSDAGRIHLLNISRANMRDPHIKKYLAENGISDETLWAGKKVLFVDTGFAGTIPAALAANFRPENAAKLKTQLIVSSNPEHPSSRVFLSNMNPLTNEQSPKQMHNTIVQYEHMLVTLSAQTGLWKLPASLFRRRVSLRRPV